MDTYLPLKVVLLVKKKKSIYLFGCVKPSVACELLAAAHGI